MSSITNENANHQRKPTQVFPRENRDENLKMPPFRSRRVFTKRSRNSSAEQLIIKLEECDDECDLVTDVPPQAVSKKPKKSRSCTNRDRELATVICADKLHVTEFTEEKSEKTLTLQKNDKALNKSEKLGNVSRKAHKNYLPDVDTDALRILKEEDVFAYTKEKRVSSAASIKGNVKKGILKKGKAETNRLLGAFVQEHATNEDSLSSRRVTQSVLWTGHSSKDETTIEGPYKEVTNTEENQSIEKNEWNDGSEDVYPYPTYYVNKQESDVTLQSSSAEEVEPSGEDTESDDPLEECRRIFYEFEKAQKEASDKQAVGDNTDLSLLETKVDVPEQKRRIAHTSNIAGRNAEIQQAHWAAVKRGQASVATASEPKKTTFGLSAAPFRSIGPMVSLSLQEVKPIKPSSGQLHIQLGGNTVRAMPCAVSSKRTTPVTCKVSIQKRPSIPESGSKVPLETRQRYVRLFLTECFKVCSTVNEAIDKALREERSVYDRCSSKKMYLNFAVKTFQKLRNHGRISNSISSSRAGSTESEEENAFTGHALYELLKGYLLTKEQLDENKFPRPNPEKNGSAIFTGMVKNAFYDAFKRVCCRCGEVYAVNSLGEHRRKEECNYHSGRVLEQKVPGGMEKRYSCCDRIIGSGGCQIAKLHVYDGRREKLEGFVKTLTKSPPFDGDYGVYAVDCETCYTTHGLELTRVTVVDAKLQVVYDTFVKPDGEVIDYDIRLSGVTEDNLKNTTTYLRDVQAVLLDLFSADTILVGHCLENDLIALKLIHDTVVDTSVVFPHRLGWPHKRALSSLMADYLKRIRQDDVSGHNSREDAIACMELILWKVKENHKKRKR